MKISLFAQRDMGSGDVLLKGETARNLAGLVGIIDGSWTVIVNIFWGHYRLTNIIYARRRPMLRCESTRRTIHQKHVLLRRLGRSTIRRLRLLAKGDYG